jgi:hypothetical protein
MPSPPATPNQKPNPVLPAPTFKYGSNTYVVLAFAKMKKKPFSIFDIRKLTGRYKNDYEVKRSLDVLENNKSVKKINETEWQITATGVQQVLDFACRKSLTNVSGN